MKFRFCGDLDAPDWILAEVSVLSKMSSVRMTLICRQVLQQLLGEGINWEKINKLTESKKISFVPSEVKAMIAALHFIFSNTAKYDVDDSVLLSELMQLGLPKDISTSICRCYLANKERLRSYFAQTSFTLPRVRDVEWRIDYLLSSSGIKDLQTPAIRMKLNLTKSEPVTFEMTPEKFRVFYNDLKAARGLMDSMS